MRGDLLGDALARLCDEAPKNATRVLFHTAVVNYVQPVSCGSTCRIGVTYTTTRDTGATWTKPQRLNALDLGGRPLGNTRHHRELRSRSCTARQPSTHNGR